MKNLNGLLAVLAVFLFASFSYGQTPYVKRVNCGDTNSTMHNGENYDADNQIGYTYTGGSTSTAGHSGFTLDTNPGEIFARTRYTGGSSSMQYAFPAPDGEYDVILHWAEPYHGPAPLSGSSANHRQFDVEINGNLKEDNLNVYGEAGLNNSLVRTYRVTASAGNGVTIDFIDQGKNDPIINAIEVLEVQTTNIPNKQGIPTSIFIDTHFIQIGWPNDETIPVSNYNIYMQEVGVTDYVLKTNNNDSYPTADINGLKAGTDYRFKVAAVGAGNPGIEGPLSDASEIISTTGAAAPTDPTDTTGGYWIKTGSNIHYSDGNIGIGTNTPTAPLEVKDVVRFKSEDNSQYSYMQLGKELNDRIYADNKNNLFGGGIFFRIHDENATSKFRDVMMLAANGNVGIGTKKLTENFKLSVEGNIRAREVKVDNETWADYVFLNDYKLPTLKEVEKHIQEKGHLINIPSAAEVEAHGIELGEMNKLLLEKIEELTLYTLEQQKQIDFLMNELKAQN